MAVTTSPDGLPYPVDGDVPDIPADLQALATAVQAALTARTSSISSNTTAINNKVLYGPKANVPGSLAPGQLYAGW